VTHPPPVALSAPDDREHDSRYWTLVDVAGLAISATLIVLVWLDIETVIRVPVALAFVLLVPGWAAVRFARARPSTDSISDVVVVSLIVTLAYSFAAVSFGWTWKVCFTGVAIVSMVILVSQLLRSAAQR
jgi:uncharacterized membrane protein